MAQRTDLDTRDRTARAPAAAPPPRSVTPRSIRVDRTLEVRGAQAEAAPEAVTLDAPARETATPPTSSERLAILAASLPVVQRDAYEVGVEFAKGGIGRVTRARDQRLDRPVAIKELLVRTEHQEERFVREALLTARLQHPAIVPVYEAGRWPDGEPFYAMKLVSGRSLSDLIGERRTLAERLALLPHVITVAQAVAYAHSQRILHRDLKPANVLVGEFGETVVIDWGLAKGIAEPDQPPAGDARAISGEEITVEGAVVGTPAYMPPEQAAGHPLDERADVYAIGAMLYHLIAAAPPYHDVPWEKLLKTIVREPPIPVDRHAPAISNELATIVHKAMARSPSARYSTARELADDLHRFQTGQIVAAHTYSTRQLLRRFWRQNRAVLAISACALVLLTLAIAFGFVRTESERREAESARQIADRERRAAEASEREATARADQMTLLQAEAALSRDPNEALAWLKTLSPSFSDAAELRRLASDAELRGISRAYRGHTAHVNCVLPLPGGERFASFSDDKTIRIWSVATGEARVLAGHTDEVWFGRSFPDGRRLVTVSKDSTARIWDIEAGALVQTLPLPNAARHVFVREDGSIVGAPWLTEGPPWAWSPRDGAVRILAGSPSDIVRTAVSADGRRVIFERKSREVEWIDVATGEPHSLGPAPPEHGFVWMISANGRTAARSPDGAGDWNKADSVITVWRIDEGRQDPVRVPGPIQGVQVSEDGNLVVFAGQDSIFVYDVAARKLTRKREGQTVPATYWSALSPDARTFVLGGFDGKVRVSTLPTGEARIYAGPRGAVSFVDVWPDGRSILAASTMGDIRLFRPSAAGAVLTDHGVRARGLAMSPNGRVASLDDSGLFRVSDLTGAVIAEHALGPSPWARLVPSPRGDRLIAYSRHMLDAADLTGASPPSLTIGTFDAAAPKIVPLPALVMQAEWHPSGDSLLVALADGTVRKIALDGTMTEIDHLPAPVRNVTVSSDGSTLVEGAADGLVRLVDLTTGERRDLGRHAEAVTALALSNDGKTLFTGSGDHTFRMWDLAGGQPRSFDASGTGVLKLVLSRDEKTLYVVSSLDGAVHRWNVEKGERLPSIVAHDGQLTQLVPSPDGRRFLTAGFDRTARIFDVATGKSRALVGHTDMVVAAAFTPDGKQIVTLGLEGAVRLWPDDLPETLPELRAWLDASTPDHKGDR